MDAGQPLISSRPWLSLVSDERAEHVPGVRGGGPRRGQDNPHQALHGEQHRGRRYGCSCTCQPRTEFSANLTFFPGSDVRMRGAVMNSNVFILYDNQHGYDG